MLKTVALASDHGGYALKESLCEHLLFKNIRYIDLGTNSEEAVDYPDFAHKVARRVKTNNCWNSCSHFYISSYARTRTRSYLV